MDRSSWKKPLPWTYGRRDETRWQTCLYILPKCPWCKTEQPLMWADLRALQAQHVCFDCERRYRVELVNNGETIICQAVRPAAAAAFPLWQADKASVRLSAPRIQS